MSVQIQTALTVGARVKGLRETLGLSQEQFARAAEMDRRVLSKIETGRNRASSWELRVKLARGFGLSTEDLAKLLDGNISVETAAKRRRKAG